MKFLAIDLESRFSSILLSIYRMLIIMGLESNSVFKSISKYVWHKFPHRHEHTHIKVIQLFWTKLYIVYDIKHDHASHEQLDEQKLVFLSFFDHETMELQNLHLKSNSRKFWAEKHSFIYRLNIGESRQGSWPHSTKDKNDNRKCVWGMTVDNTWCIKCFLLTLPLTHAN